MSLRRWETEYGRDCTRKVPRSIASKRGMSSGNRVTFSQTEAAGRRPPSTLGKTWNQVPEELRNASKHVPGRGLMMLPAGRTILAVGGDGFATPGAKERQRLPAGSANAGPQRIQHRTASTKDGIRHGRKTILDDRSILKQGAPDLSTGERPCLSES